MTPQQQAALEALVSRTLTAEEVAQIDALLPTGSVGAIAALLSVGRTRVVSHFASERGVLERNNAIIAKPFTCTELARKVRDVLESRETVRDPS